MADLSQYFGDDLVMAPSGDLALASGSELGTQRVIRRLLTNLASYLWEATYGAGLRAFIGDAVPVETIKGRIRSQLFLEGSVKQDPAPIIKVTANTNGQYAVQITYVDATSGAPQLLDFDVTANG